MDAVDGSYGSKNSGIPQFAVTNKIINHIFYINLYNLIFLIDDYYSLVPYMVHFKLISNIKKNKTIIWIEQKFLYFLSIKLC